MRIIYTLEEVNRDIDQHSIFLAGPTPRSKAVKSWRPEAIECLKSYSYDGLVYVPEFHPNVNVSEEILSAFDGKYGTDSVEGVYEWEHAALTNSKVIAFWIPRELKDMPAFTTNIEAGRFFACAKSLYGRPDDAPKNKYLDWYYNKVRGIEPFNCLGDLLWDSVWLFSK